MIPIPIVLKTGPPPRPLASKLVEPQPEERREREMDEISQI